MTNRLLTLLTLSTLLPTFILADTTGFYLGGGLGAGIQNINTSQGAHYADSMAYRAFAGYQIWSFLGAELGYTHIGPANSWNNVNSLSSNIVDLSVTPGLKIPLIPLTVYARLGFAGINTSSSNNALQTSGTPYTGEWGGGAKIDIPFISTFVRAEYINFGNQQRLNSPNGAFNNGRISPSTFMLSAGYIF